MVRTILVVVLVFAIIPVSARPIHRAIPAPQIKPQYMYFYAPDKPYRRYGYYHGDFQMGGNQEGI